jgi:hypothetical protein
MSDTGRSAVHRVGARCTRPLNREVDVTECQESLVHSSPHLLERTLRVLGSWLVSAARKGAPVAAPVPCPDLQNRLDAPPDSEVGSSGT